MDIIKMIDLIASNPKYIWAIFSVVTALAIVFSFVKAHFNKENPFDLIKLFAYNADGTMSDSKARLNAAFVVTSWAFIFLTMDGKLTEWYVGVFLAAWVGDRISARLTNNTPDPIPTGKSK